MRNLVIAIVLLGSSVAVLGSDVVEQLKGEMNGEMRGYKHEVVYASSGQLYRDGMAGKFKLTVAGQHIEATVSAVDDEGDFMISDANGTKIGTGACYLTYDEEVEEYLSLILLRFNSNLYLDGDLRVCDLDFSVDNQKIEMRKVFDVELDHDKLLLISGEISSPRGYVEWETFTAAGKDLIGNCDDERAWCPPDQSPDY